MKDFNSRPEDYYSVGPNKQVIDIINDEIVVKRKDSEA